MKEKIVGSRIKRLREQKAWTQEHLADAAVISARTVQRAEEGVMSAETLTAISGALDVSVESLSAPNKEPENYSRITPALFYQDPNAAYEWLARTFGFQPQMSIPGPDGKFVHAEMEFDGGTIMMGQAIPAASARSPQMIDGQITMSLFVFVEDADAHCAHSRKAGARILNEPQDVHGMRRYLAEDLEGHHWWFAHSIDQPKSGRPE